MVETWLWYEIPLIHNSPNIPQPPSSSFLICSRLIMVTWSHWIWLYNDVSPLGSEVPKAARYFCEYPHPHMGPLGWLGPSQVGRTGTSFVPNTSSPHSRIQQSRSGLGNRGYWNGLPPGKRQKFTAFKNQGVGCWSSWDSSWPPCITFCPAHPSWLLLPFPSVQPCMDLNFQKSEKVSHYGTKFLLSNC